MLSIGEVARRADLRASTIRFYEEKGLLPVKPQDVQRVSRRRFATRA